MRPRLSSTTRSGWATGPRALGGRAVSCGLSTSTVSAPTRIASSVGRMRCAQASASGPLIQRESPLVAAIRPSSVAANLAATNGSPVRRWWKYAS